MNKEKGITLISLIVTIIVLIILTTISISITVGENGIFSISKQSKENLQIAATETQEKLNELYTQREMEGAMLPIGGLDNEATEKLARFKEAIANYIEEAGGVKPSTTADEETFGNSIKGILKEVTKDATATAEDIKQGKTAYVNGEKITGIASEKLPHIGILTKGKKSNNKSVLTYTCDKDYRIALICASASRDNGTGLNLHIYLNDEKIFSYSSTSIDVEIPSGSSWVVPEGETYVDQLNADILGTDLNSSDTTVLYHRMITIPVYNVKANDVIKVQNGTTDRTVGAAFIWGIQ